ncbi:eukaryotic translation initiation factor 5 [Binucleata daphniae]
MPALKLASEGKSHNTKTVLQNISEIAKSLNRSTNNIIKFIECEKGVKIECKDDKVWIKGKHETKDLQNMIYKYINMFVLCKVCDNPETVYKTEDEKLYMECLACGEKSDVVDHKITKTILNDLKVVGEHFDAKYTKTNVQDIIKTSDVNEAFERINEYKETNEMNRNEIVIELIKNYENKNAFLVLKKYVEKNECDFLLSNLELILVQNNLQSKITECIEKIVDNDILEKEDCKRYFGNKSKVLKRDESNAIRKNVKMYFKE